MVAASISMTFLPLYKPIKSFVSTSQTPKFFPKTKHDADASIVRAVSKEQYVILIQSNDFTDHQVGILVSEIEREVDGGKDVQLIGGFGGSEGRLSFEGGFSSASSSDDGNQVIEGENIDKLMDRTSNATIVLVAGTFGITKLLTINYDYWRGWTIFEILIYAPQHGSLFHYYYYFSEVIPIVFYLLNAS